MHVRLIPLCIWGCRVLLLAGIRRLAEFRNQRHSGMSLGWTTREGESPVHEMFLTLLARYLSTVGHVKPCGNLGGPPSKAKYVTATDSEEVP